MKIVILGAGAVGGYFGGRLAEAGVDVTFLVREKRAAQLRRTGLVINSTFGDLVIREPQLATTPEEIGPCDLVILGLKNYHLQGALAQIRSLAEAGAKILPIMNGIEHFSLLIEEVGPDQVLGGMCKIISTLDEEGRVIHTNRMHNITFGPLQPSQREFCEAVKKVLDRAKLQVTLSENVLVDIWNKYAFITAYSGTTTASRLSIDQILAVEASREVYARVLQEMWTLARKNNVALPDDFVEKNLQSSSTYEKGSTSSMHQDFRKGLPLEVESLQGAAVRLAQKCGVGLPTVSTLYGLIKPYEHGPVAD